MATHGDESGREDERGRIPFAAGSVNRGVSRLFLADGRGPTPIPGPWTLEAVIRVASDDPECDPTTVLTVPNPKRRNQLSPAEPPRPDATARPPGPPAARPSPTERDQDAGAAAAEDASRSASSDR